MERIVVITIQTSLIGCEVAIESVGFNILNYETTVYGGIDGIDWFVILQNTWVNVRVQVGFVVSMDCNLLR